MSLINRLDYEIRLKDARTGKALLGTGGAMIVVPTGTYARATLYDQDNGYASLAQPVTFTSGGANFAVATTVNGVDIYGMTPQGYAFQLFDVKAGLVEVSIDTGQRHQMLAFPAHVSDFPAAAETASGFTEPANGVWLPSPFIDVIAIDATETVDVGTDGSGSNDPNGLVATLSVGTLGLIRPTLLDGSVTLGALLQVESGVSTDVAQAPQSSVMTGDAITLTYTTGSDTAVSVVYLPYMLAW